MMLMMTRTTRVVIMMKGQRCCDADDEDARTSETMYPTLTSCQYPGAHHPRQAPPAAMRMPAPQMQDVTRQAPPTA